MVVSGEKDGWKHIPSTFHEYSLSRHWNSGEESIVNKSLSLTLLHLQIVLKTQMSQLPNTGLSHFFIANPINKLKKLSVVLPHARFTAVVIGFICFG